MINYITKHYIDNTEGAVVGGSGAREGRRKKGGGGAILINIFIIAPEI